jgi:3',5'-cyclic AMP phosphodiesterase CpdA
LTPYRILHLSDLHLGKSETRFIDDGRGVVPPNYREDIVANLYGLLRQAPIQPDIAAVIISGDITNRGDVSGFDEFVGKLVPHLRRFAPNARLCLVPGNHDVAWGLAPRGERFFDEKFANYRNMLSQVAALGIPVSSSLIPTGSLDVSTGKLDFGADERPLHLFAEHRLAVLCVNSSIRCGELDQTRLDGSLKLIEGAMNAMAQIAEEAPRTAQVPCTDVKTRLDALKEEISRQAINDVVQVTQHQRKRLQELLSDAKEATLDWREWTKVAVLHHHLVTFNKQNIDHKAYELLLDASDVLGLLEAFDFDLVLTGHKHQSYEQPYGGLTICGGLTVGGHPSTGFPHGGRLFSFQRSGNQWVREVATITLKDVLDPTTYLSTLTAVPLHFNATRARQDASVGPRNFSIMPRLEYDWFAEFRERLRKHEALDQEMLFAAPGLGRNWFDVADASQNAEQLLSFKDCLSWLTSHLESDFSVVDLGAGTCRNIASLVSHLQETDARGVLNYYPVDISYDLLSELIQELERQPWSGRFNEVLGVHSDLGGLNGFRDLFQPDIPILYLFLGATLGNLESDEARLQTLSEALRPRDRMLLQLQLEDDKIRTESSLAKLFNSDAGAKRFFSGPFMVSGKTIEECTIHVKETQEPHAVRYNIFCELSGRKSLAHPRLGMPIKLNYDKFRTCVLRIYRDKELEKFLGRANLEIVDAPQLWTNGKNCRRYACILCKTKQTQ